MKIFRRILLIITLVCCAIQSANAASFTIKRIETQGNQRLTSRAVLSYAPVHVGQKFDTSKSGAIIQSLFASGDFSNVQLLRRGNTLIVRVQESPVISQLIVTGNKEIDDKTLNIINVSINGLPQLIDLLVSVSNGKFDIKMEDIGKFCIKLLPLIKSFGICKGA